MTYIVAPLISVRNYVAQLKSITVTIGQLVTLICNDFNKELSSQKEAKNFFFVFMYINFQLKAIGFMAQF